MPWVVSDDIVYRKIEDIERQLLTEYTSLAYPIDAICENVLQISIPDDYEKSEYKKNSYENNVKLDGLCIQTSLNLVASDDTMVLPYGVIIEKEKTHKIKGLIDFELDFFSANLKNYELLPSITLQEIQGLISLTRKAARSEVGLQITFRRYCTAFMKTNWEDRLIDLTIALESLIPIDTTEISFRFKLFLSLMMTNNYEKREEVYKMLGDLYSARSGIVHGSSGNKSVQNAIKNSKVSWNELVGIAKNCILYRLEFNDNQPNESWSKHLTSLSIGLSIGKDLSGLK